MPLLKVASFASTILELPDPDGDMLRWNHVLEPEFHQDVYAGACANAKARLGAFQLGNLDFITRALNRGTQPTYADDEQDPETLEYEGHRLSNGEVLDDANGSRNVCALKSVSIRAGYIDFAGARSVTREFYEKKKARAGVQKDDVLINSTGDGTIGRVAVYDRGFPAVVDGHITIVRFKDPALAWYSAAYLMSDEGQNQIYRYINGSSGQVEIYPQDLARVWIPRRKVALIKEVADKLRSACAKHEEFALDLQAALMLVA